MLLTEEQAKTKWCPHARSMVTLDNDERGGHFAIAFGNQFEGARVTTCMSSACTQWRWVEGGSQYMFTDADADAPGNGYVKDGEPENMPWGKQQRWRYTNPNRRGYCGLAGRPEDFGEG